MIIGKVSGKVLHHNDCTYCQFRHRIPFMEGKKKRSMEVCKKHERRCVPVGDPERYCEDYRQINCDCDNCQNAFDERLDKS